MSDLWFADGDVDGPMQDAIIEAVMWDTYCTVSDELDRLISWDDGDIWGDGSLYAAWRREVGASVGRVR